MPVDTEPGEVDLRMIISETPKTVTFSVTEGIVEALLLARVLLTQREGPQRHSVDGSFQLTTLRGPYLEPYVGYWVGKTAPRMGAFSYSFSGLPLGVQIGRYCSIASGVTVMGFQHPIDMVSTSAALYEQRSKMMRLAFEDAGVEGFKLYPAPQKPDPVIGHDVWIGEGVTIAKGVSIGHGSIIAARSVVTKDVPPYWIVGGVPAKVIRPRFSEALADRMSTLR